MPYFFLSCLFGLKYDTCWIDDKILQSDLQQLLSSASDHQASKAQSQADIRTCQELVSALTAICDSGQLFEQFREEVSQHKIRECCVTLQQLDASVGRVAKCGARMRSEEHTSELQSLMRISYAVFCLKKKK